MKSKENLAIYRTECSRNYTFNPSHSIMCKPLVANGVASCLTGQNTLAKHFNLSRKTINTTEIELAIAWFNWGEP